MELIDRYMQAIRFWLPKDQKRDIIQELSEDLLSQIEEKESALGRKLSENEVAEILKQRGRPTVIAGHYLPQRYLIGPLLFPVYTFVLKMVALFYLLPWLLVWIGLLIFNHGYRAEHLGFGLLGDWAAFWQIALFALAVVTLVFAIVERAQAKSKFLDQWDPRKLPAVVKHHKPSFRSRTLLDLFFNANFVVWWLAIGHYPHTFFGVAAGPFKPAAGLGAYYWPVLGLALVNLAQQITNAFRPQWTWLRPATLLVTNTTFVVLLTFMLKINPLVVLTDPYVSVARYMQAARIVNIVVYWCIVGMAVGVFIACCVYVYQTLQNLRRWLGRPGSPAPVQIV